MDESLITSIVQSIFNYSENIDEIELDIFIKNISNSIIEILDLKKYVQDVKVLEVYDKNPASRGLIDKEKNVCIFKNGIEDTLEELLQEAPGLNEYEIKLYRCLLYIKTLLHELGHAKQEKLLEEDGENNFLETLIVRLCKSKKRDHNFGYFCLYDFYPAERLAEIQALEILIKVINCLNSKMDMELLSLCIQKQLVFEWFCNYYRCGLIGSTEKYFEFLDSESLSILKSEKEKRKLSLEDRVLYGLEISRKEYEGMLIQYEALDEKINELLNQRKK